jgi:hypothetical protein
MLYQDACAQVEGIMSGLVLAMPEFKFPWDSACAPDGEELEKSMVDWAESHGLFLSDAHRQRVLRTRYACLAARCYPHAERALLQTIADYFVWYFLADDLFVDRVEVISPSTLSQLTAMLNVLDLDALPDEPIYGKTAWLDICRRFRRLLPAEHFQRFANGMRLWASTAGLQILNHLNERPAGLPQYMAIRRHTSGMNPCLDLGDVANGGPLPAARYCRDDIQTLRLHANNIVCWANDIQSLGIEMHQPGQFWNMVAIHVAEGMGLQQAVDRTAQRVRAEIDAFVRLADTVEDASDAALSGFIRGMKDWVRGYLDWVKYDTQRYSMAYWEQDADDRRLLDADGAERDASL